MVSFSMLEVRRLWPRGVEQCAQGCLTLKRQIRIATQFLQDVTPGSIFSFTHRTSF